MATTADRLNRAFSHFANKVAGVAGNPVTFTVCLLVVVVWAACGPLFKFSDTWQLVINTGTTIVTFLMVFLIQNTQNRDGAAIQAKLDELIRVGSGQNTFVGIEHLTEEEVEEIRQKIEARVGHGIAAGGVENHKFKSIARIAVRRFQQPCPAVAAFRRRP